MKFARDTVYANEFGANFGNRFGEYMESFASDSGQVSAEIFKQNDELVAYVTFADGITGVTVQDSYVEPLYERAAQLGFRGNFRIVYAGS